MSRWTSFRNTVTGGGEGRRLGGAIQGAEPVLVGTGTGLVTGAATGFVLGGPIGAIAGAGIGAVAGGVQGYQAEQARKESFASRTRQAQAAEAERARIGENVATAREIYGVGQSATAQKNKQLIGQNLTQKEGATREAGLLNLAGQTNEGLRQTNVMGAESGNFGSNFQARQRSILGASAQGRADLAGSIESLRPQQERNLLQQRLGLERLGSGSLGFNTAQASMDQANALKASTASIVPSALGNLIAQGGQMMGQYQQAQSQGQMLNAMAQPTQPMTPLAGVNKDQKG